jgi:RNA polymerase sigma-70 factor, ECF subfamily
MTKERKLPYPEGRNCTKIRRSPRPSRYAEQNDFVPPFPSFPVGPQDEFLFWKVVDLLMYVPLGLWTVRHSQNTSGLPGEKSEFKKTRGHLFRMSSPPNERALAFPVVWGTDREIRKPLPEPTEIRSPSDEDLMARVQGKDPEGLDLLYARYSHLVFGIALRILRDKSEAEEVVQEAFFAVYQKAPLFDPARGCAKGWMVQIAFSRARDRRAHLLRRGFYSGTDIESLDDTLQGQSDIEREVGLRIDFSHLLSAFEELTQMQRKTLDLFYFQGMELREISQRLNEPIGNVRHHFYRGLDRLRKSPAVKRLQETQHEHI